MLLPPNFNCPYYTLININNTSRSHRTTVYTYLNRPRPDSIFGSDVVADIIILLYTPRMGITDTGIQYIHTYRYTLLYPQSTHRPHVNVINAPNILYTIHYTHTYKHTILCIVLSIYIYIYIYCVILVSSCGGGRWMRDGETDAKARRRPPQWFGVCIYMYIV